MGAARRRGAKSRYRRGGGGVKRAGSGGEESWKDGRRGTAEGGKTRERETLRDEHCKVKDRDLRLGVM